MRASIQNSLLRKLIQSCKTHRGLSSLPSPNPDKADKPFCLINCKNSKFDHYIHKTYDKFDQVPLVSKGWTHSKSKGDHFTINPLPGANKQEMIAFEELNVHEKLIEALHKLDVQKATEFQAKVIPLITSSKHLMLAAETGCGKTIAYLLPIIQSLIGRRSEDLNTPAAVIIVPSRELAHQVGEISQILGEPVDVKSEVLVGGATKRIMMNPEFNNIDILVATPGVLGKLSTVGVYKLNKVLYTVVDEADTLIDDSFIDRMSGIIQKVSQSKMILVSATLPRGLPDILKPIESNLEQVASPGLHRPCLNISQKFLRMTRSGKPSHLLQIAKSNKNPMIVFTNRSKTCDWVALFLRENGLKVSNIQGDMNHAIRIEQWNNFIKGETMILASTDVGSRGLDTVEIRQIVNYDFPVYAADYLHRIGRIGRLGSKLGCKAFNFISGPEEVKLVQNIELAIRTDQPLDNVDGNITHMVQKKILRGMKQTV